MELDQLKDDFSVCQIPDLTQADLSDDFCFIGKTDQELSLVCRTSRVPAHTLQRQDGWKAFRIRGVLDFSLIGILARISELLASNGIGIFVISTYNTDYVLVKAEQEEKTLAVLKAGGYAIKPIP